MQDGYVTIIVLYYYHPIQNNHEKFVDAIKMVRVIVGDSFNQFVSDKV